MRQSHRRLCSRYSARYSGGLGTANQEGVGDGLSATAFDWPRVLVTFCQCKSNKQSNQASALLTKHIRFILRREQKHYLD